MRKPIKSEWIECDECEEDIECEMLSDEYGEFPDYPERCPHCGAELYSNIESVDVREDFHSDI